MSTESSTPEQIATALAGFYVDQRVGVKMASWKSIHHGTIREIDSTHRVFYVLIDGFDRPGMYLYGEISPL